jgi:hypothetical protein
MFKAGMEGPPMTEEDQIVEPSPASDEVVEEREGEKDGQSGSQFTNGSDNSTVIRAEERLETQNNRTRSESSTDEETNQSILAVSEQRTYWSALIAILIVWFF